MTCADVSVDELVQTVYLKIKQMKRELTLTDIAGYLPYGLKVQEAYQDIWTIRQLGNIDPCRDGDVGSDVRSCRIDYPQRQNIHSD